MVRAAIVLLVVVGCRGPARTEAPMTAEMKPVEAVEATPTVAPVDPNPAPAAHPVATEPAKIRVSFVLAPEIGEGPPVLTITAANPSAQAVPMTRFEDAGCVVRYYLDLRVTRPDGKPQALAACAVKDWPGRDLPLPAGGELKVQVALADLAPTWPRGTYAVDVGWNPAELARVRGETAAVLASQTSLNVREFRIARPLATVKIARGETVTLPDGLQLKFSEHSHKDVGPGYSSPLILRGMLTRAGQPRGQEFSVNLHTEETRVFWLQDTLGFVLVDYAYDEWIRVNYYGELKRR